MLKNLYYGLLHVAVAMTAILFVTGVTGINLPLAFLTIGVGTLLFHWITGGKLAVLMGVSGSYIAGMTHVAANLGPQYAAGGVVMSGVIYLAAGALIKSKPTILRKFPRYVLNMAVFLIALTLLPIGSSMIGGMPVVAAATLVVTFLAHMNRKTQPYAMPIGVGVGTIVASATAGLAPAEIATGIQITLPNLASFEAFTMISVVAIAVVFETLGDAVNCANAQGIELSDDDMAKVITGNGVATFVSGSLGGLPLTTYSENVGFIYMTGWKDPMAQRVAAVIFIVMAFMPGIAKLASYIPVEVFGALLVFLFALIGANGIKNVTVRDERELAVILVMLVTFFAVPALLPSLSPVAAAIIAGVVTDSVKRKALTV